MEAPGPSHSNVASMPQNNKKQNISDWYYGMVDKKKYIQFNAPGLNFHGMIAELIDEYEGMVAPMVTFYTSDREVWCIRAKQTERITEKEFFMGRLNGTGIFKFER